MRAAHQEDVLTAMLINDPATMAELRALYPRYEEALVSNDVETLMNMFWASPYVARFGPTETLYGISEIEAFRKGRSAANLARTITRLEIVTFGKDFASITVAFERDIEGKLIRGRQSQTWARLAEGWRIVFAHVSILP
jgi:phenylpyruvate tautomerase PptA (4-oxalocrotonate tautomerase family)